jgi:hypothetical protein
MPLFVSTVSDVTHMVTTLGQSHSYNDWNSATMFLALFASVFLSGVTRLIA